MNPPNPSNAVGVFEPISFPSGGWLILGFMVDPSSNGPIELAIELAEILRVNSFWIVLEHVWEEFCHF